MAQKVAVLREPLHGYDAPANYTPGKSIEVRRAVDHDVAFSGPPVAWGGGNQHAQSGDRVWWFDFSALTETGSFFVHDPTNKISSEVFSIDSQVYRQVLVDAVRVFYYQRCGASKATPHTHAKWSDGVCHHKAAQDLDCRSVLNPVSSTSRDLSGGWHDAGDYNKYVNYADDAVHPLLTAYEIAPLGWGDNFGLPESGNGVPDVIDEVCWELKWLLKMQTGDGCVLHKVSVVDWSAKSPPSTDDAPRRYAPPTASATISACGVFAHAAAIMRTLDNDGLRAFGARLEQAASDAWRWLEANPSAIPSTYNNAGFLSVACEDEGNWQTVNRLRAAVWMYVVTGDVKYRDWFDANYRSAHLMVWGWASPWEQDLNEALLRYTRLPGATPSVVAAIRRSYSNSVSGNAHLGNAQTAVDAYRAPLKHGDYTWGSNRTKAMEGAMFAAMNRFGMDLRNSTSYLDVAADFLHYLHGVNPVGKCYLTNMAHAGAEDSLNEMYHSWFAHGTVWDSVATSPYGPPPGYLTGGPNPHYRPDSSYRGPPIAPPQNQPVQKSYRDWNTSWPQNSWEVSECHIPYQAAYIRLLAMFALAQPPALGLEVPAAFSAGTVNVRIGGVPPGGLAVLFFSLGSGSSRIKVPFLCANLGLQLGSNPWLHVLGIGRASSNGVASCSFNAPAVASPFRLLFQAVSASTCSTPVQSTVVTATLTR